jgi:hypothetical protein
MFALTRRAVVAVLLVCGTSAVARPPAALAADDKLLSAETIVEKQFKGKATVEFSVEEVHSMPTNPWSRESDGEWKAVPLRLTAKAAGKTDHVYVFVSGQTVARLRQLGIEEPEEHFHGKVVRVSGTVEPFVKRAGTEYRIQVNSLDQLEVVRKP